LHGLTQPQEGILKTQGASDSLIQSLRNSNLVASKEEAAAVAIRQVIIDMFLFSMSLSVIRLI